MKLRLVVATLITALGLVTLQPAALAQTSQQSAGSVAAGRTVPDSAVQIQLSFAPLVRATAPAVVNIFTRAEIARSPMALFGDEFFNAPFGGGQTEKIETALGSGVILSSEGLVVTNYHVIRDGTEVEVELTDGREFNA